MNKNELVSAVAEKAGLTKADAASAVDAVFETVQSELKNGGDIRLAGVVTGLFCVSRLLFWVGYLIHPYLRAPGMIMTLNVNAAIVGYALYQVLG